MLAAGLYAAALLVLGHAQQAAPAGPAQPLPFSHKIHAGTLDLPCGTCHLNPDPGKQMHYPTTSVCLQCHKVIKKDSPAIQKLASIAQQDGKISWVPIYQLPSYVYFSHRAHSKAGARCLDCHGRVALHEVLFKEGDISMGGCIDCHMKTSASVDCQYCHEAIEP
ncbi:MAG: cytochrome c3 family protein [Bryobacterales bacterium]|nr:cytochrome c3 family protein [Bryobacterales bacterium]